MTNSAETVSKPTPVHKTGVFLLMQYVGWGLFAVWVPGLILIGLIWPDPYANGWRLVLEMMFLGRLMNIADGFVMEFSKWYLLFQCGLQDIILLLVAFPWVVEGYHHVMHWPVVGKVIANTRAAAARHKRRVQPFGVIGVWLLVFFPFWSTGVLVCGVLGYILGMRVMVILTTIISAHIASAVSLLWFFDIMERIARPFSEGLATYLPFGIVGVLLLMMLLFRFFSGPLEDNPEAESIND